MGGQITHIPQQIIPEQNNQSHEKIQHHDNNNVRERQANVNKQYRFQRISQRLIPQLEKYKQLQSQKYNCIKRITLISQNIHKINQNFLQDNNNFGNDIDNLSNIYLQRIIFPLIQKHQQTCFQCTGRHWQVQQWKDRFEQQIKVQEQKNKYKRLQFKIRESNEKTDSLQVVIYKYLQIGDGFMKNDKVRNMKIYKFPLSQLQLTNLIFQHQYLVVECQNSYWSFEKDSKRLIVQSSVLLSDVRDKCLGESRSKQMGFKWFGLREKWYPQVMYESNQLIVENIKEVRVFAQHFKQVSLKYDVFKANCKVYAQYIMKNCIKKQSWDEIQTFFDFLHK